MLREYEDHGKLPRLNIPAESYATKAIFWDEPGSAIIKEIKDFIKRTGRPYLWRGHTHTKPPKGARVVYLESFDLPEAYARNSALRSPCPCCRPVTPWFKVDGKIAWFPDEGVIRLIGPDCFKSLSPDGHATALADLRRRQQRESEISFLIRAAHNVRFIRDAVDDTMECAKALDVFRGRLLVALSEHNIPLWNHARNGELKCHREKVTISYSSSGGRTRKTKTEHRTYARIQGFAILAPGYTSFEVSISASRAMLDVVDFNAQKLKEYDTLDDSTRATLALGFKQTLNELRESFAKLDQLRRFSSHETVKTLKTWAALEDAALNFYVDRDDSRLIIGGTKNRVTEIAIPAALDRSVPQLPELRDTDFN